MKVLFAISNEEISESIVKRYQSEYKQIISSKNVYYFNAILKEIQKDKTYDRIVISEDLEAFTHSQYDQIDKFIFDRLDSISDEASNGRGSDIPIILICTDRRTKSEEILVKLFGIGVYNALIGNDRSVDEVCKLLNRPRTKKEAKDYYKIDSEEVNYTPESENDVSEVEIQNILAHYRRLGKNEEQYVESFDNIAAQYNDKQLRVISRVLPLNVKAVLEEKSDKYRRVMTFNSGGVSDDLRIKNKKEDGPTSKLLQSKVKKIAMSKPVVIPSAVNMNNVKKLGKQKYNKIESADPVVPHPVEPVERNKQIPETKRESVLPGFENESQMQVQPKPAMQETESTNVLPGFENKPQMQAQPKSAMQETESTNVLPGFENKSQMQAQPKPAMQELENTSVLPGFENEPQIQVQSIQPQQPIQPEPVEEPKKRRRGRPRKENKVEEQKITKRRRGRPRKNPEPEEHDLSVETQPTMTQQIGEIQPKTIQQGGIETMKTDPIKVNPVQQSIPEPIQQVNDPFADVQPLNAQVQAQPTQQVTPQQPEQPQQTVSEPVQPMNDPFADIQPLNTQVQAQPTQQATPQQPEQLQQTVPEPMQTAAPEPMQTAAPEPMQPINYPFADIQPLNAQIQPQPIQQVTPQQPMQPEPMHAPISEPEQPVVPDPVNTSLSDFEDMGTLPGFESEPQTTNSLGQTESNYEPPSYEPSDYQPVNLNQYGSTEDSYNPFSDMGLNNNLNASNTRDEYASNLDLSRLLTPDKKLVACLGTSKNGTSFIINNLAELTSSMGIKTAILDTTTNRNSYYIYTKNEESLREIALNSFDSLINKQPEGIKVNKNLTVFTSLPDDENKVEMVDEILETLVNNYSLILIDTDFNTPLGYFKQAQELYLVQSLDILTIQPLTAFLRKLKSKNALDENKIRIILNKAVKVKGIQEKTIIGGMAFYTDPAMSYMTELFDRNTVKYITIPFEDETYIKYLENIINCEITLKGYSKIFMQSLKELANMVYPLTGNGQPVYRPPQMGNSNMNSTLDQMRRNY